MKNESITMGPLHLSLIAHTEEYGKYKTFLLLRGQPLILPVYLFGLLRRARPNAKPEAGQSKMTMDNDSQKRIKNSFGQVLFSELADGQIGNVIGFLYSRLQDIHNQWRKEGCLVGFKFTLFDPFAK